MPIDLQVPEPTTPGRRPARLRTSTLVPAGLALLLAVHAVLRTDAVRVCGTLALVAVTVAAARARSDRLFSGQEIPFAAAITLLTVSSGGVVDGAGSTEIWKPILAVAAYPLLGRALIRFVGSYRLVRTADLVVEAALIGAAVAILLQVGVDSRAAEPSLAGPSGSGALPALLVGFDVMLVVVLGRSLGVPLARRGPLGVITLGVAILLASHVAMTGRLAVADDPGLLAGALVPLALVALGAAMLHPRAHLRPALVASEPPLFSGAHAGVVVAAMLAAPLVLVVQALRDVSASATVATGTLVSGSVLAAYLVGLLRERAASEHQATHDALTALPNRLLFADRLERAIAHAERNDAPVGVLFIDLDGFKDVNDTLGHSAGDELLRITAERLLGSLRREDTVARLGGDEFAVLLPHLAEAGDVHLVVERVQGALREPATVADHQIRNVASIGVALFPDDGATTADLLVSADTAMYRAKEQGGNTQAFGEETSQSATEHLETETALFNGIQHDELVLHYQPIVDAAEDRVVGAEALVRWQHPEKGLLSPGQFIPVAERSDLVVLLGEWVIHQACCELARWADEGFGDRFVSVNVSGRHFNHDLVSAVTSSLRETGADPANLVVELTESAAVDNISTVADALRELRELGVRAAIDDFGTGYCGLQYLADLPVSSLKLDKSFVQAMTARSSAIVAATIAMAHSLGLSVVAEGIENDEQRDLIERSGCDEMQGFHLARPMPVDALLELFQGRDRGQLLTVVN